MAASQAVACQAKDPGHRHTKSEAWKKTRNFKQAPVRAERTALFVFEAHILRLVARSGSTRPIFLLALPLPATLPPSPPLKALVWFW